MAFQADAFQADTFQILHAGVGGAGAATFSMLIEAGARLELEWQTDITTSVSGLEQRAAVLAKPRQRFSFGALLSDAEYRRILGTLTRTTAGAPLFLLALPYEDLSIVSSTTSTVDVYTLAMCDWAAAGQRIVVVAPHGEIGEAVVQFSSGTTIGVDQDLTAVSVEGSRVMPAVGVYLDPEQGLSRFQARMGRWDLAAIAVLPGFGASSTMGTGATLATLDGLPIWERGVGGREATQPILTGAELVDLGARVGSIGSFDVVQWGRALLARGTRRSGAAQYLKKFLDTVRGSLKAFLLPTGRPDLLPIGTAASGTLTIDSGPGGTDYIDDWYPSLAHRRVSIVLADGTRAYRSVVATSDGGATQDLALSSAVAGTIARVEFLETVRLAEDRVTIEWDGAQSFSCAMSARVVQQ